MRKRRRFLLLILPLISSLFFVSNFQIYIKKSSLFSQGLRGTQSWNLVHTWIVGWCIMSTWIGLLVFIYSFISSIFFLPNSKTLIRLSHFSVRPTKLKLDTHMGKWLVYCVHQIQAARIYLFFCYFSSSFFFFFFCFSSLQRWKTCINKIVSIYLWWLRPGVYELWSLSAILHMYLVPMYFFLSSFR